MPYIFCFCFFFNIKLYEWLYANAHVHDISFLGFYFSFFFLIYFFFYFYIYYIKFDSTKKNFLLNNENYDLQVNFNASIFCIIKTYISNHAHVHDLDYKNLYLSISKSHFWQIMHVHEKKNVHEKKIFNFKNF